MDLRPLGDAELLDRLSLLTANERDHLADIIAHLAEVERRCGAINLGYPSLYLYCREKLGYSEAAAFYRVRAARTALKHPEIVEGLRDGTLHLEAVVRLSPHLTVENKQAVLAEASGASRMKVLEIVADLGGGMPSRPESITPLAVVSSGDVIPPPRRVRVGFEMDKEMVSKVEKLKGLLRHKYPFVQIEDIFREGVEALLDRVDPERKPKVRKKSKNGESRTRLVPESVKREVWKRDGGRCTFQSDDGRRCESTDGLQYDHVVPFALGGRSDDPENIRLLCGPHNRWLGRKTFGPPPTS